MKFDPRDSEGIPIDRRSVLRAAGTGILAGGAAGVASAKPDCAIPDSWGSEGEEDFVWRTQGTSFDYQTYRVSMYTLEDRAIEVRSGIVYLQSYWDSDTSAWRHQFLSGGFVTTQKKPAGSSNDNYEYHANIDYQRLRIDNQDQSKSSLWVSSHPSYLGAYPPPGSSSSYDYGSAAKTVLLAAIGMTNPTLAVATTTYSAVTALVDNYDSGGSSGEEIWVWDYSLFSPPCEGDHFCEFEMRGENNSSETHFHIWNGAAQQTPSLYVSQGWNVDIDAYDYNSTSMNTSTGDDQPEPSAEEYEDFLERSDQFEKARYGDVRDAEKLDAEDRSPEDPIYIARNPRVEIKPI